MALLDEAYFAEADDDRDAARMRVPELTRMMFAHPQPFATGYQHSVERLTN